MQQEAALISRIQWVAVLVVFAEFVAIAALWWWAWRRGHRPGLAMQILLLVLTVRFVLFATPFSWAAFYVVIGHDYFDARERDIVANNVKAFLATPSEQSYLAVGSSQTRAVYSAFSKHNPIIGYYVLAGMSPMDYFTEYDAILKRRPRAILLYVSEFDLGRPVDLDSARLSNLPIEEWLEFFRLAAATAGRAEAAYTMVQIAVADLFPESKYSFLFADLGRQVLDRLSGHVRSPPHRGIQARDCKHGRTERALHS